jgi:hypothetical protein
VNHALLAQCHCHCRRNTVSFNTQNPLKPVEFGLKMFVLSHNTNGYIYNFKPYTGKTENGNPDLVKTTQIVRVVLLLLAKMR